MIELTLPLLKAEAQVFVKTLGTTSIPVLYGINDGKTVGTFVEHGFRKHLQQHYTFSPGNSASDIDFPELEVDLKVTSIRQPQSSCPFRSASQKVYGMVQIGAK